MNSRNDLKSGQKKLSMQLLILIAVIILVAAVGLVAVHFSSGKSADGEANTTQAAVKLLKDISLVQTNLYKIQSMVMSNIDKKEIEKFSDQQAALIQEDLETIKKLLESGISQERKKFFQAILGNLTEFQKSALRFMKLAPAGTGAAYLSAANEKMDAASGLLVDLVSLESKGGETGGSPGFMFFGVLLALAVLLVLSVFMIPGFIQSMMKDHVIAPISEVAGVLKDYVAGKPGKPLDGEGDDTMGDLVRSVNLLRAKLSSTAVVPPASGAAKAEKSDPEQPSVQATSKTKAGEDAKTLSGLVKKTPEDDGLVLSSRKAIDKLQDI